MRRSWGAWIAALLVLGAAGCSRGGDTDDSWTQPPGAAGSSRTTPSGASTALYLDQVLPILKSNCYRCHGGMNHRGGLNLETQAGMMQGGKNGRDVLPGDPDRSLLVTLMRHQGPPGHPMPMPPSPRPKLPDAKIEVVARWVREGALMPADVEKP